MVCRSVNKLDEPGATLTAYAHLDYIECKRLVALLQHTLAMLL